MTRPEAGQRALGGGGSDAHYSYALYADPQTAERFDAARFGGPIGSLLAATQERLLVEFLGDVGGKTVLDVGAGTGRASLALARRGAVVTGLDASAEMLKVARRRAAEEGLGVLFVEGDAHRLDFPDRSFDAAVSLRVLMHTPDWRRCLSELCRVSRHRVVLDFPARTSFAALHAAGRRAAAACGRRVEAYRVLPAGAVASALRAEGFRLAGVHRQFVLPIALHKLHGSRRLTERLERSLAAVGLLRLLGSPVTVVAERCGS